MVFPIYQSAAPEFDAGLRQLIHVAGMLVWEIAADGRITQLNPDHPFITGGPRALHIRDLLPFVHLDDVAALRSGVEDVCASRRACLLEFRLVGGDGNVRQIVSTIAPRLSDGGALLGFSGSAVDITARQASIKKLNETLTAQSALNRYANEVIIHCAEDFCVRAVSPSITARLGHETADVLERSFLEFIHADDIGVLRYELENPRRRDAQALECRLIDRNGDALLHETKIHVLEDRVTGERVGIVLVLRGVESRDAGVRAELERANARLTSVLESIGDCFFSVDRDWRVSYANCRASDFLKRPQEELVGKTLLDAVPELRDSAIMSHCERAMDSGEPTIFQACYEPTGTWTEVRAYPHDEGLSIFFKDISDQRETELAYRGSLQRVHDIIELTPVGYVLTDASLTIVDVNPAMCAIIGRNPHDLVGVSLMNLFSSSPFDTDWLRSGDIRTVAGCDGVLVHRDGHAVHVLVNANAEHDRNGNLVSLTVFLSDITERKQAEDRLEKLALHDTLTGLPNRTLLNLRLQEMLETAPREETNAIMFIDLDRFKEVNDSMGHKAGDVLLCEVAQRLQAAMRPSDIVARLGGDEFVVVANCRNGAETARQIAGRILELIAAPMEIEGQEIFVGGSIGVSMFPADGTTKESLFQNADTAMYRAKAAGRNCVRLYTREMGAQAKSRIGMGNALRRALENGQFDLHYQPRVNVRTLEVIGVEALLRWRHPQLGQVPPGDFIPVAEEIGIIEAIGAWALEEACTKILPLIRIDGNRFGLSVNLSARQVKSAELPSQVDAILRATGFPPNLLELELTETALVEDIDHCASVMRALKGLGVSLAVDDFGTGYSGFAYLRRFPVDIVKLDQSIVEVQDDRINTYRFLKGAVDLAHSLNMKVVAEGVEVEETLRVLRQAGCDEAQGYLFARPMPLDALEAFIAGGGR